MTDLTSFIKFELKPRFFDNIPFIFPQMGFKLAGGKWQSRKHYDGTEATHPAPDKSVVTREWASRVYDNARQDSKDVIDLYKELNGIASTWEAVEQLCQIVGIDPPKQDEQQREKYRKHVEQVNLWEASALRQQAALYSPEGASTLDYLHRRGWADVDIKKAGLGYISRAEAATINAQPQSIGDFYTLSIPLRSAGSLYGFKFRTIQPLAKDDTRSKYTYLSGTSKKENLFNLTPILQKDGRVVVVEGELDALHAEVLGVDGIVATSGGKLTPELLDTASKLGIKRITLLFDKDERGRTFTEESIKAAREKDFSVLVCTFPDETLGDGTSVHDLDEYLAAHTAQELEELVSKANRAGEYLADIAITRAAKVAAPSGGEITDEAMHDLTEEVISIANKYSSNEVERDIILDKYSQAFGGVKITKESLLAVADRERQRQDAQRQKRETGEMMKEASTLLADGDVKAALKLMEYKSVELLDIDARAKYSHLLATPTDSGLLSRMKKKQGEVPTQYVFKHPYTGEVEDFSLPSGAITLIVALTSHGKSTLLQNLALQVAQADGEGDVLYFTFEEDGDSVTLQMMNKYINAELCRDYGGSHSNNLRAIYHYYRTGEDKFIITEQRPIFQRGRDNFIKDLYESGRLRVFYEDYDSNELIAAIRTICRQIKVRAVFIDYVQLLSKNGNKKQRNEELKDICKDLKNLCVETQLPIVLAAQTNREVTSPLEMHSQKIAEAADLERIANKIMMVWNSAFTAQTKKNENPKALEAWEKRTGVKLGTSGKIFAKMTKNRGGVVGVEAVLDFNGNTGVISQKPIPKNDNEKVSTLY